MFLLFWDEIFNDDAGRFYDNVTIGAGVKVIWTGNNVDILELEWILVGNNNFCLGQIGADKI